MRNLSKAVVNATPKVEPQERRFQRVLTFMPERKHIYALFDNVIEYSEEQRVSLIECLINSPARIQRDYIARTKSRLMVTARPQAVHFRNQGTDLTTHFQSYQLMYH